MGIRRAVVAAVAMVVAIGGLSTACSSGQGTTPSTTTSAPPSTTSSVASSTVGSTTESSTTASSTSSTSPSPSPSPSTTEATPKPKPTDPITGGALSNNPVIAVKIDNTAAGFPQFGITAADIIYAEQVEGGLTRLIAIFHTSLPKEVGAVRSIRSTDLQLLPSYGRPILVASGGAPRWVRALNSSVLVGVLNDGGAAGFWRSAYGDGTHNLHANLQTVAKTHPGKGKARPMGFVFSAKDTRLGSGRTVNSIDVTMLAGRFEFTYGKDGYLAHHSGTPYVDQHGKKVYVQNVLVQHVQDKPDGQLDPIGNPSYISTTVGSGTFSLFRNGHVISGTWSRKSVWVQPKYVDSHGNTVTFAPGKTWVLLAPQTSVMHQG